MFKMEESRERKVKLEDCSNGPNSSENLSDEGLSETPLALRQKTPLKDPFEDSSESLSLEAVDLTNESTLIAKTAGCKGYKGKR